MSGDHAPSSRDVPILAVTRLLTAGARDFPPLRAGRLASKQLTQSGRPGLMQSRAHGHLDCLQVELAGLVLLLKDEPEERAYFAGDFLLDRFRRFFSCSVSVSSAGLKRQIFSFTWSRLWLSSRKR